MFGAGLWTPPKGPTGGLQASVELGDLRSNAVRGQRPAHSSVVRPTRQERWSVGRPLPSVGATEPGWPDNQVKAKFSITHPPEGDTLGAW